MRSYYKSEFERWMGNRDALYAFFSLFCMLCYTIAMWHKMDLFYTMTVFALWFGIYIPLCAIDYLVFRIYKRFERVRNA